MLALVAEAAVLQKEKYEGACVSKSDVSVMTIKPCLVSESVCEATA